MDAETFDSIEPNSGFGRSFVRLARSRDQARGQGRDGGFTLVELMVVLLVIAILIAVVIPTYRGARERAQDRVAQLNLRTALIAAKVAYSDLGGYGPIEDFVPGGGLPSTQFFALNSIEPTLYYGAHASIHSRVISVEVVRSEDSRHRDVIKLATLSDNDVCWFIWDDDEIGTFFGQADLNGISWTHVESPVACNAINADTVSPSLSTGENVVQVQSTHTNRYRRICFYSNGWQPIYRPEPSVGDGTYSCPRPGSP